MFKFAKPGTRRWKVGWTLTIVGALFYFGTIIAVGKQIDKEIAKGGYNVDQ